MLQIPRQQVLEKWDVLPDNLKEALCSESNDSIIWQIGALNHLPEEKISMMATIVGDVIFGFLHPDDLTREIRESLNLNPQIANSISREINRKIFAPLRSDLEKIYNPVTAMPEVKPPTKPEMKFEPPEIEPKPLPVEPPTETELKPFEIPQGKPFDETQGKPAPFPIAPTTPTAPTPVVPTTPVPAEKPFDEAQGKPFILHQETESKPVGEKKRVSPPIIGWFRKAMPTGRQEKPEPPIKVELETLGPKIEERKEPMVAKTEAPKQKVIHYREVEMPTPFGKPSGETPPIKVEPQKPPDVQIPKKEEPPKPEEPKVISLDSFEVVKEKEK